MPSIPDDKPLRDMEHEEVAKWLRLRGYHVVPLSRVKRLHGEAVISDLLQREATVDYMNYVRENLAVRCGIELAKVGALSFKEFPRDPLWDTHGVRASCSVIMPDPLEVPRGD